MSAKVALVTGGASGIGAAACIEFSRHGCIVVAADLDGPGLQRTLEAVNSKFLLLLLMLMWIRMTATTRGAHPLHAGTTTMLQAPFSLKP